MRLCACLRLATRFRCGIWVQMSCEGCYSTQIVSRKDAASTCSCYWRESLHGSQRQRHLIVSEKMVRKFGKKYLTFLTSKYNFQIVLLFAVWLNFQGLLDKLCRDAFQHLHFVSYSNGSTGKWNAITTKTSLTRRLLKLSWLQQIFEWARCAPAIFNACFLINSWDWAIDRIRITTNILH
jgi:hypothetical protein